MRFQHAGLIALCLLLSSTAWALDVFVQDQNGKAVENAYVGILGDDASPDTADITPAVMDQVDVRFVPHVLAVKRGQAVVFPNSDNIRHHVYSFSNPKQFEIKLYEGVPENPIVFDQAGIVVLGCNIHDGMLGYIVVSPWSEYAVTEASGKLSFAEDPQQLSVWHPWMENVTEPIVFEVGEAQKMTVTLNLKEPAPVKKFSGYRKRYYD